MSTPVGHEELRKGRARLDMACMVLFRLYWARIAVTHPYIYILTDGSPQWRGVEMYASSFDLFLDVNGRRIELETDALHTQTLFQKACLEKINLLPPTLRKQDWENLLNALLKEMVETEQITEASEASADFEAVRLSNLNSRNLAMTSQGYCETTPICRVPSLAVCCKLTKTMHSFR